MRIPRLAVMLALLAVPGTLAAATLDDAVTSLKVRTVLLERFGADALGIQIEVSAGNVVLSGSVDRSRTRDGAEAAAREVKGVAGVQARIALGNGPATKTRSASRRAKRSWENSMLETRVKARLFEQVGGNALKIRVQAEGSTVTLEGTVPTGSVRATALDTARATKGVSRVVERLAVGQKAG